MKIETFQRHIREAYRGVLRNSWMSIAAMTVVTVTLFIFGFFLIFILNANHLAKEIDYELAILVTIKPSVSKSDQKTLLHKIKERPDVRTAVLVPKKEALDMIKKKWGKGGDDFFKGLEADSENPLPDAIKVQPISAKNIDTLQTKLQDYAQVGDVEAGEAVTGKLRQFSSWAQSIVLLIGIGLALFASFLISNTIKLTILARKSAIEIQRLVGASNWFIRWPFIIEGTFIGIVGAILPIIFTILIYIGFVSSLGGNDDYAIISLMPVFNLSIYVSLFILLLGIGIGISGSIISIRRFLKV